MMYRNEAERSAAADAWAATVRADIRRLREVAPTLHPTGQARAERSIANLNKQLKRGFQCE